MNLLFVCSKNKWRSKTAETVFGDNQEHLVKSAGTEKSARIRLNQKMVNWADVIFVMEKKHKVRILENFDFDNSTKNIEILNISDDYLYMDEELIESLKTSVNAYLNNG